jgi:micrococcal nuclease
MPVHFIRPKRPSRVGSAASFAIVALTVVSAALCSVMAWNYWRPRSPVSLPIATALPKYVIQIEAPPTDLTPSAFEARQDSRIATASSARFSLCSDGGGANCVVDGDTFWFRGAKIRLADIDTPETHPARCAREEMLGNAATARMHKLLNEGPFELESIDRNYDRYGRNLRIVTRGGRSLGDILISEGLARPYDGGPRGSWCY